MICNYKVYIIYIVYMYIYIYKFFHMCIFLYTYIFVYLNIICIMCIYKCLNMLEPAATMHLGNLMVHSSDSPFNCHVCRILCCFVFCSAIEVV